MRDLSPLSPKSSHPAGSRERAITIGRHKISDKTDAFVIAEIGHNHQGSLEKAKELLHSAYMAGAHAVKLQKRHNKTLFTRAFYDKPYENENSFGSTYGRHREALEFGRREYTELADLARKLKLEFLATAFDFRSADFLREFDLSAYKIASGDLKTIPLIRRVASLGKPVILSSGGGTMEEIRNACRAVLEVNPRLVLLHCVATYPNQAQELNLRMITTLRDEFPEVLIGLSDHYNGIAMAPVAYVLGARIFEKHFTLNRAWKGTDNAFSLEPIGLHKMLRDLRRTREALGDGVKRILPQEAEAIRKMAKSLVAARDLPAGAVLRKADIAMKSPGGGLDPSHLDELVGKKTCRAIREDECFSFDALERDR
ncbi:MAG: N-acetylneuraminate synthase family protein [Terrimicrobiaceae bacterium]